ncbi:MAG TPA: 50S ribosomal protein L7Ae-like protein [Firmicutes bacterium]|nr:50S ribosomal protein L7Ae-like protein [Bacillota bacterium]
MPGRLANSQKAVGAKQTLKAVQNGQVELVYLALDADGHVTDPIRQECEDRGIAVVEVDSMAELGQACSIEVGAAVASILKPH